MKYRISSLVLLLTSFTLFCGCEREEASPYGYEPTLIDVITEGISLSPPDVFERTAQIPSSGAVFSFTTTGENEKNAFLRYVEVNEIGQRPLDFESKIGFDWSYKADWGSIEGYQLGELYKSAYKVDCAIEENPSSEPRVFKIYLGGFYAALDLIITQEGSE